MKNIFNKFIVSFSKTLAVSSSILKKVNCLFKNNFYKVHKITQKLLVVVSHKLTHSIIIDSAVISEVIANTSNQKIITEYYLIDISLTLAIHIAYLILKDVYKKLRQFVK
ncbi:hypothetical protein KORDIASMS9_00493 [Kordia sp. SMS9]|nr:hypothetical protein KORDIASMS9_00493 [Kordia sp. SMS9]